MYAWQGIIFLEVQMTSGDTGFFPSCSPMQSHQLQKRSWSTPLCAPQINFGYMCFIDQVGWTVHVSQCEYGVCSLSMLSALSVIADDGWFYEFADKPVTVFYVEFY